MSDLRARIIKAVRESDVVVYRNEWEALADAVIAELGLKPDVVHAWNNNRSWVTGKRYVTEWEQ